MAISNANANGIPFIKNMRGIPKSIKDAMVLWYDISRQKATNESMVANPILKDFSGNGNDATCYNFAWAGMSGIGGYPDAKSNILSNISSSINISTNEHKVVMAYNKPANTSIMLGYDKISNYGINTKIKIKAGKYGLRIWQCTPGDYADVIIVLDLAANEDGEFIFSEEEYNKGKIEAQFGNGDIYVPANELIEFEFLPLYPNALVSDGVDDYAMVQNKYAVNFTTDLNDYKGRADFTCTNSKIIITNNKMNASFKELPSGTMPSFKIKVTGITNISAKLRYGSDFISSKFVTITEDGEYTLPAYIEETKFLGFRIINYIGECNITIEQLPTNKSLIFNKENGYTVIAKRKILNNIGCLCGKRYDNNTPNGAFNFECYATSHTDSFASRNNIQIQDELITYQIKESYNDITINYGNADDSDKLTIFGIEPLSIKSQVALYSLLLFNRDLTDDEIDWVKYNLL